MRVRYEDLPELPPRPHDYYAIADERVPVTLPGRPAPVVLRCKVAGEGPPLVLVHGLMTSSYSFRYVITPLAEHHRVIVPDLPGAGLSDAPVDLSMAPQVLADVLAALLEALGLDRPYVVGNSLGGYLGLWLAARHPARVGRLMVMHAPGFPELRVRALTAAMAVPGSGWVLRRLVTRSPETFVARNVHYRDPSLMSREEAREYGAIFRDPARTEVFRRVLAESLAPAAMRALLRQLPSLAVPVRLLWSREDVMVPPAFGPRYQAVLPGARLVWLERTSHFMHVDTPGDTIREILEFGREAAAARAAQPAA